MERAVKEDNNLAKSLNVNDIFSSWSDQSGYPLLVVKRDYQNNTIKISQERYFNKYPYPEQSSTTWWIPYNFDTANNVSFNNTSPDGWLPQGNKSTIIKPDGYRKWSAKDWVLFNKQQTGFYRVLYDEKNYNLILRELNSGNIGKIHPLSRSQFLDDVDAFVQSGRLPYNIYFDLIRYLRHETEYGPWMVATRSLLKTRRCLDERSDAYKKYNEYVAKIVKPFYELHTFDGCADDSFMKNVTRAMAIELACEFGIENCSEEAKQLLEQSVVNGNFSFKSSNTRGVIYKYGIRFANSNLTELIWNRMLSTENSEERQEILNSFGNIANQTLLTKYLYQTIDSNNSLSQEERMSLFIGVATRTKYGLLQAMNLLTNEADETRKHLDMSRALRILAENINSNDAKNRVSFIPSKQKNENFQ